MGFLKNRWDDIRPNLLYDLLKYAAMAIIAVVSVLVLRWIQHIRHAPQQDLLGYAILAVLVFLCLSVNGLSTFFLPKQRTAVPTPAAIPPTTDVFQPQIMPHVKAVDIHGSVEELYFYVEPRGIAFMSTYSVYMRLILTNRGTDEAVITKWNLHIWIGEDDKVQGGTSSLPINLAVRKPEQATLFMAQPNFRYEAMQPDLTRTPTSEPYKKGIPKEGWICFDVMDYGSKPPINGSFFIYIEDSLGYSHWITRKSQSYKLAGEIVELPDASGMLLTKQLE